MLLLGVNAWKCTIGGSLSGIANEDDTVSWDISMDHDTGFIEANKQQTTEEKPYIFTLTNGK